MSDFQIKNGVLTKYTGPGGDVVIPQGVTSIDWHAFYQCEALTSVVIPESVTSIGVMAFDTCSNLESVTLPEHIPHFGEFAFLHCDKLADADGFIRFGDLLYAYVGTQSEVTIPDGITRIEDLAFVERLTLTTVTIPEGVTSIGSAAFVDCKNLTTVTLPQSLTSIGYRAFANCINLCSIAIPESVTSVGSRLFTGCAKLADADGFVIERGVLLSYHGNSPSVVIPGGVVSIDDGAFQSCESMTTVTIPESVTTIGKNAFCLCSNLKTVVIPKSVTSIGHHAFYMCKHLADVTFPDSLKNVDKEAFHWCGISTLRVTESAAVPNSAWRIKDFYKDHALDVLYAPGKSLTQVVPFKNEAAIGYADMICSGQTFSEELDAEYLAYITRQRKKLYPTAMSYPGLLRYMMMRKIIPVADVQTLLTLADENNRLDLKAEILEYVNTSFTAKQREKALKL